MAEEAKVSLLERSLSLSQNGGIYYGGARVEADERAAVLFVGLGGSGADALLRIKDQVKTRMILPLDKTGAPIAEQPKNIGFLEIDTDDSVQKASYGTAHFDQFGKEFCNIAVKSTPDVIADIKKAKATGEECWQWFDDDVNQVAGSKGAGGIRQIGRMLLMNNIAKVINAVSGKIERLTQDNQNIERLVICVFSGISGGTGAGTFLDMAYILRKIARKKQPNTNIMGYLLMPDVNEKNGGQIKSLRTNGFSSLKELDYWMNSAEHEDRYYQKFPNGFELNEHDCPFDFCHLLDGSDIGGHNFSYDKILRSVAENVFAYIAGENGGQTATGTMASMYDNIQLYIRRIAGSAKYPAGHNYLSLGAAKIEIPYTEISTLIAARVFQRLNAGMFQNRPTEKQFNISVFKDLEMTEECIRSTLYKNVTVQRPLLEVKNYKYTDVWPNNAPYQAVHNWLATFQREIVPQAANLPAYLEGKLKEFIKRNLKDKKTGPVYLRYYVKSQQNYCLYHMLEGFRKYCSELQIQCASKSKELRDNMNQAFAAGSNLGAFDSKSKALDRYLKALNAWYRNEEHAFLNEKIVEVLEAVQSRLELYYNNILRPLSDVLTELPGIFDKNVEYIKVNSSEVNSSKVDESTDILIKPLEFEQTRKNMFDAAVVQAENNFLESLSGNIQKWIGRDIDGVDENISTSVDISGFISNFVSENFAGLLTIGMQDVMNSKLRNGESLADYIRNRVEDLLNLSYPMYKENTGIANSPEEFAMISVPKDCPLIEKVTREHIKSKGLERLISVKNSEEKNRMYIIKISSGYPIYSNAFIEDMEKVYEEQMTDQNTSSGNHLKPEWRDSLPSPCIEPAWRAPYTCERTKKRNDKYKALFEKCYANGIIVKDKDCFILKRANPEVAKNVSKASLTAPTILSKMVQFVNIKSKLWNGGDDIKLFTCGTHMKGQPDGEKENVKENILRFPLILDILEQESELADKIETIEEELHYPKYFSMANMNHMIRVDEITGDTSYQRTELDSLSTIELTKRQEMHPDYEEFQIYQSFCRNLNKDMKDEIELQYENLKERIKINPNALQEYIKEIRKYIQIYEKQAEKARNEMYDAGKEERPAFLEKIEFYRGCIEELERMLPMGVTKDGTKSEETTDSQKKEEKESMDQLKEHSGEEKREAPEPQTPPRYLNPQTWQPIENPQPGQQVFDTKLGQMVTYTPEAPKPPRYLNPQTWQPIENPQPGQMVFDTQLGKVVTYAPEAPRYLNPQTWQPIENPQPGQQVFDTKLGQMVTYTPEAPKPPRYLNPQTWQPIENPQPGQPVFDTQINQMIYYNPYQQPVQGGYPGMAPQQPTQGGYPGMAPQQPVQGGYPGMPGQQPVQGGYPGMPGQQPVQGGYPGMPGQQPVQGGYPGMPGQQPTQGGYPGMPGGDENNQQ